MMRINDLEGKQVRTNKGENLGQVYEIQIENNQVKTLLCSRHNLFQRLFQGRSGQRIAWQRVTRITDKIIYLSD